MNSLMEPEAGIEPDATLVERCHAGDREAFGRMVARYQNLLSGLAYCACGDLCQSEDLAQQTFLIAWTKLPELESPEKLRAWLCGILRNLASNAARTRTRDPLTAADCLSEETVFLPEDQEPAAAVMTREEKALMWRLIQNLPPRYREPLVLFYRSGDSSAEVAATLGLSEETVRQRLTRGRVLLGEQAARLVGHGLKRTCPSSAFTLAVLAALPAPTATAAGGAQSLRNPGAALAGQ